MFRFWRRHKIAPGATINLSKSSPSISLGPRGGRLTLSSREARFTFGIPGTGLFWTWWLERRDGRLSLNWTRGKGAKSRSQRSTTRRGPWPLRLPKSSKDLGNRKLRNIPLHEVTYESPLGELYRVDT